MLIATNRRRGATLSERPKGEVSADREGMVAEYTTAPGPNPTSLGFRGGSGYANPPLPGSHFSAG
jgi:hypothetical protein